MLKALTVDGSTYDVVPDAARILTETLLRTFERAHLPDDVTVSEMTPAVWDFIDIVYKLWKNSFPQEYATWFEGVQHYLKYELPVEIAVKGDMGYFPISYPIRFHNLIETFFPKLKLQDKSFIIKFLRRHGDFKVTNYTYG